MIIKHNGGFKNEKARRIATVFRSDAGFGRLRLLKPLHRKPPRLRKAQRRNCAPETVEKPAPTFAFICKDLSQEWFVGTSTSMKETAVSLGAKDVIMYDCAMSPDKYMTALDNAISQKVDVLIVCPPDQKLSQITVDRCEEAGIRVMADDDG